MNLICQVCSKPISSPKRKFCGYNCRKTEISKAVTQWRRRVKLRGIELLGGKCILCGYNKCARSLDFHHLDPSTKSFNIGDSRSYSWETIKAELTKCVLLCRNCHGEVNEGISVVPTEFITPDE